MKKRKIFLLLMIMILLSSCNYEINSSVYIQDMFELSETSDDYYAYSTLVIPYLDEDKLSDFESILLAYLLDVENVHIEEIENRESGIADFSIPLVYGETFTGNENTFSIYIEPIIDQLNIYFVINTLKYDLLKRQLKEDFYRDIDFSESEITIEVINDVREDITFYSSGVYVNGIPAPFYDDTIIEHRDSLEIRLSDVIKDSLNLPLENDPDGYIMRLITTMDLP